MPGKRFLAIVVLLLLIIFALYAAVRLKSILIFFVVLLADAALLAIVAMVFCFVLFCLNRLPMLRQFLKKNRDELLCDFRLFWSEKEWETRVEQWTEHSTVYSQLKLAQTVPSASSPGTTRIDYLSGGGRLAILDSKFSTLLTLQSLMGVLMTLAASNLRPQIEAALKCWGWWATALVALPILLWIITVFGCIITLGNVRWGDLWKEGTQEEKERRYVEELVRTVVVRTAMLRVFSAIALIDLLLNCFVVLLLVGTSWPKPVDKDPSPIRPAPVQGLKAAPPSWYAFNSGQSCADDNDIGAWIKEIADSVFKSTSRKGVSIASADVRPLGAARRAKHGNNIGLAFDRAQCVADGITHELSSRGIQVQIDVRVRDVRDRGKASVNDRVVTVEWSP
jgi:hypothetical protein